MRSWIERDLTDGMLVRPSHWIDSIDSCVSPTIERKGGREWWRSSIPSPISVRLIIVQITQQLSRLTDAKVKQVIRQGSHNGRDWGRNFTSDVSFATYDVKWKNVQEDSIINSFIFIEILSKIIQDGKILIIRFSGRSFLNFSWELISAHASGPRVDSHVALNSFDPLTTQHTHSLFDAAISHFFKVQGTCSHTNDLLLRASHKSLSRYFARLILLAVRENRFFQNVYTRVFWGFFQSFANTLALLDTRKLSPSWSASVPESGYIKNSSTLWKLLFRSVFRLVIRPPKSVHHLSKPIFQWFSATSDFVWHFFERYCYCWNSRYSL